MSQGIQSFINSLDSSAKLRLSAPRWVPCTQKQGHKGCAPRGGWESAARVLPGNVNNPDRGRENFPLPPTSPPGQGTFRSLTAAWVSGAVRGARFGSRAAVWFRGVCLPCAENASPRKPRIPGTAEESLLLTASNTVSRQRQRWSNFWES